MPGTLFVVATPIGNLEDITVRALRVLREVALIAAEDTRRTAKLLARHAIATPTTSLHEHNERAKSAAVLGRLKRGESVALVSDAGTPTVSDPGQHLIRQAIDAGFRVEPVPGPSAILAALSASGLPAVTFSFLGFPPVRSKDRYAWFERLAQCGSQVVFFEAPHRLRRTLEEVCLKFGDCHIIVARELTKTHEQILRGPITAILESLSEPIGEFTVILDLVDRPITTRAETPTEASSRRQLLSQLAKSYGLTANELYRVIEIGRQSAAGDDH